jgi:hypothetical protein
VVSAEQGAAAPALEQLAVALAGQSRALSDKCTRRE